MNSHRSIERLVALFTLLLSSSAIAEPPVAADKACTSDVGCPGQICVQGKCRAPMCSIPQDCPAGQHCRSGRCWKPKAPTGCRSSADCGEKICVQGRCRSAKGSCATDTDCPAPQICEQRRCLRPPPTHRASRPKPKTTKRRGPRKSKIQRGMEYWSNRILAAEIGADFGRHFAQLLIGLDVAPAAFFSINAAFGYQPGGAQVRISPRFRLPLSRHGLYLAPVLSYGHAKLDHSLGDSRVDQVKHVVWLTGEFGWEFESSKGFRVRVFAGYGKSIYNEDCTFAPYTTQGFIFGKSHEPGGVCDGPYHKPYVGAVVGYRFL